MPRHSITFLQACFMIIMSTGLMNHVTVIPLLLREAHKDGWISVLIALVLALCWIPLLLITVRAKPNRPLPLFSWVHSLGGSLAAWMVTTLIIVYLFFSAFVTLEDTATWTKISYLPNTPTTVIAGALILLSLSSALIGIHSIAICAGILLPIVIILGYVVMSANFQYKDYSLIFPIFEHGISPIINGLILIGAGMAELILIIFLLPHMSSKPRFRGMSTLAFILAGLTIGPYIGSIANFGIVNASFMRYPAFEQWRIVTAGKYIEHLDFLSIYQWLSGSFIRIALAIFLIIDAIPHRSHHTRIGVGVATAAIIFLAVVVYRDDIQFVNLLRIIYFPSVTYLLVFLSVIFAFLTYNRQRRYKGGIVRETK
ncbi:endospore germination permease [Paenibacillaceae sp. P-4]|uniref:GerAB/ArcD/ProY family transporter n=1 Tax=Paenibacillaceae bacterium P-4 TaxID=3160969 RepID=UPI0032E83BE3